MRLVTLARIPSRLGPGQTAETASAPFAPLGEVAILVDGDAALALSDLAKLVGWPVSMGIAQLSLAELLTADPTLESFRRALAEADPAAVMAAALRPGTYRCLAPIPRPGKAIGVGYNYLDHVREQGLEKPARPTLFSMFSNAVVGDGDPIRRPAGTHALDLEAELAVVIGRRASRVAAVEALACVAGYTIANDVTARDWQGQAKALRPGEKGDPQWLRAKGSDTFLPLGPVLVTPDELGDGRGLAVGSWLTRASAPDAPIHMQDGDTKDLLFGVAELIEMISAEVALEPGDVIATGTPDGVGVFRDPPIFLEPGDLVRIEVERIGALTNPITDADGNAPNGTPAATFLAARAAGATGATTAGDAAEPAARSEDEGKR